MLPVLQSQSKRYPGERRTASKLRAVTHARPLTGTRGASDLCGVPVEVRLVNAVAWASFRVASLLPVETSQTETFPSESPVAQMRGLIVDEVLLLLVVVVVEEEGVMWRGCQSKAVTAALT